MTNGKDPITTVISESLGQTISEGLSKEEYFASQAMVGLLSSCDWKEMRLDDFLMKSTADIAVRLSKKLIIALNKEEK